MKTNNNIETINSNELQNIAGCGEIYDWVLQHQDIIHKMFDHKNWLIF